MSLCAYNMTESEESCGALIDGAMVDKGEDDKPKQTEDEASCLGVSSVKFRGKVSADSQESSGVVTKKPPKRVNVRPIFYHGQAVPTAFVTPRTVSMSVQPPQERHGLLTTDDNGRTMMTFRDLQSAGRPWKFGTVSSSVESSQKFDSPYATVGRVGRTGPRRPLSTEFAAASSPIANLDRALSPYDEPYNHTWDHKKTAPRPSSMAFCDDGTETTSLRLHGQNSYDIGSIRNNDEMTATPSLFNARRASPTRWPVDFGDGASQASAIAVLPTGGQTLAPARPGSDPPPLLTVFPRVRADMPQKRQPSRLETFHSTYISPNAATRTPTSFLAESWIEDSDERASNRFQVFEPVAQSTPGHSSVTCYDSDDRLDELERRMRQLERRLGEQAALNRDSVQYSQSLRDLNHVAAAPTSAALQMALPSALASSTHGVFYQYSSSTHEQPRAGDSVDRIERLSTQIKRLQDRIEEERDVRQSMLRRNSKELLWKSDENETLKCRVKELEAENQLWRTKLRSMGSNECQHALQSREQMHGFLTKNQSNLKPSLSMDDLIKEKQYLEYTVSDLQHQLARVQSASTSLQAEPPPDQYVPMHRYRLLKAKSKKLLFTKCESLRNEILAKETMQVQMQLQNKELSELRQKVYQQGQEIKEHCECGASLKNLDKQREKLLKAIKTCSFASSCLLGICKDLVNKKCPDQDLILGIKADNGMTSSFLQDSENRSSVKDMRTDQFYELVNDLVKQSERSLTDMQNLMVEYYTDELVGSIDCKLQ